MKLLIDPASASPPFEQLRVLVRDLVAQGALPPGTRLPTVRSLAAELGLAPNTVARAYRELESDGIIETRGRNGSFASSLGNPAIREAQERAAAYAQQIRKLGVNAQDALRFVSDALENQILG